MEAERGLEEQLAWGAAAGSAACLCPAAVAAAGGAQAAGSLSPRRHALEQEMLRRADLQQLLQGAANNASGGGGGGGGDRRRERRMKNRESAARSRARRYAYVNELEKEVSLLRAENDELRKLCQELKEAALAPAPVKKAPNNNPQQQRPLQRTSSSPF